MIVPSLNSKCCSIESINNLLASIDKWIYSNSIKKLNNIRFSLSKNVNMQVYWMLTNYREIIIYRIINYNNYSEKSWIELISRVKNILTKNN